MTSGEGTSSHSRAHRSDHAHALLQHVVLAHVLEGDAAVAIADHDKVDVRQSLARARNQLDQQVDALAAARTRK